MTCAKSWQVYNFANEKPVTRTNIVHSAIRITFTNGTSRIYEWGGTMPYNTFVHDNNLGYIHPGGSWFGELGQPGIVPHGICRTSANINASNKEWLDLYGKGGSYPRNCRGYVHWIIRYLKGSENPQEKLNIENEPAYEESCASRQAIPRGRTRSNSPSESRSKSRSKSRSESRSKSRSKSRSESRSKSRRKSRHAWNV